jgi:hypothetical protein
MGKPSPQSKRLVLEGKTGKPLFPHFPQTVGEQRCARIRNSQFSINLRQLFRVITIHESYFSYL